MASTEPMEQVVVQGTRTATSPVSVDDPAQALNQLLLMPSLRTSPTLARAFNRALANAFDPQVCQSIGYMVCLGTSQSRASAIANAEGTIGAVSASTLAPFAATEFLAGGLVGTETFFRTMAAGDFAELVATGRLVATGETFISPSLEFASGFEGVTVRFELAGGTTDALFNIGVRTGGLDGGAFGSLNLAESGWGGANALFKLERGWINIGLGQGDALSIFNSNIVRFSVVR